MKILWNRISQLAKLFCTKNVAKPTRIWVKNSGFYISTMCKLAINITTSWFLHSFACLLCRYNIEEKSGDPVGGATRFTAAIQNFIQNVPTLVLFSGDAFSPSNRMVWLSYSIHELVFAHFSISVSTLFKGKQMAEVLNLCHIKAACIGNHDFGKYNFL